MKKKVIQKACENTTKTTAKKRVNEYYIKKLLEQINSDDVDGYCEECGEPFTSSWLTKRKRNSVFSKRFCSKICNRKKYSRENRDKHREYCREYAKRCYSKNREKILAKNKEWRIKNKDKIREYAREYCARNREKINKRSRERYKNDLNFRERRKEYQQKNRQKLLEYYKKYYLRKSNK